MMIPDNHNPTGRYAERQEASASCLLRSAPVGLPLASCFFYSGVVSVLIGLAGSGSCPSASGRLKMWNAAPIG